ncbi:hypothetical protein [Streptomyces sp. ISL-100]|uniref:hypothetical protein n=1 Tax=Streptomyces sp. ISL-100 TaxID=2819173 RepID=UPI001BE87BCB|nr:hypothetical protein [Streptomyces sp. ISL-100]MBT2396417.1 hypothetical protein [Streptomyces sp. ISL-100]
MRRTTVRRTAVAASAISLALLVTACGSDKPVDAAPEGKGKESAAAEPAAKTLSQAELDKLVLAEGDLKNHKVTMPSKADVAAAKTATADKAECKPLVDAMALRPVGTPAATAPRRISSVPAKPGKDASTEEKVEAGLAGLGNMVLMSDTLGSYDGKGAQEALAGLRTAGEACADGFTMIAGSDKTKVTKVAPGTFTTGDEAVAFTLTSELDGESGTSQLVAVRKGNTLVSFYALSLTGKTELPKEAIDAQLAKLAGAPLNG